MWNLLFLSFYIASVIISVLIAILIDKALERYLNIKVKAPVFITIAVLLSLWWVISLFVN